MYTGTQKQLHREVVTHTYNGVVCRFRYADNEVFIPICDAQNLLQCRYGFRNVYSHCGSATRIEFYANGDGLMCILPYDLYNLCKGYYSSHVLSETQNAKIIWLKNMAKIIKEQKEAELAAISNSPSSLQIFNHDKFGAVRTTTENDDVLFCLTDVCKSLDLTSTKVACRLTDDVLSKHPITDALGRQQIATFVNEDGLYDVILDSRKPEARAFRKWITSEVLPSIRQHGIYATPATTEKILNDPDFGIKLLQQIKEEREAKLLAQAECSRALGQLASQNDAVKRMQPKEEYYDEVIENREHYSTTQIASELGISYYTLRKRLYKAKLIISDHGTLTPADPSLMEQVLIAPNNIPTMQWTKEGRDIIFAHIAPNMPK